MRPAASGSAHAAAEAATAAVTRAAVTAAAPFSPLPLPPAAVLVQAAKADRAADAAVAVRVKAEAAEDAAAATPSAGALSKADGGAARQATRAAAGAQEEAIAVADKEGKSRTGSEDEAAAASAAAHTSGDSVRLCESLRFLGVQAVSAAVVEQQVQEEVQQQLQKQEQRPRRKARHVEQQHAQQKSGEDEAHPQQHGEACHHHENGEIGEQQQQLLCGLQPKEKSRLRSLSCSPSASPAGAAASSSAAPAVHVAEDSLLSASSAAAPCIAGASPPCAAAEVVPPADGAVAAPLFAAAAAVSPAACFAAARPPKRRGDFLGFSQQQSVSQKRNEDESAPGTCSAAPATAADGAAEVPAEVIEIQDTEGSEEAEDEQEEIEAEDRVSFSDSSESLRRSSRGKRRRRTSIAAAPPARAAADGATSSDAAAAAGGRAGAPQHTAAAGRAAAATTTTAALRRAARPDTVAAPVGRTAARTSAGRAQRVLKRGVAEAAAAGAGAPAAAKSLEPEAAIGGRVKGEAARAGGVKGEAPEGDAAAGAAAPARGPVAPVTGGATGRNAVAAAATALCREGAAQAPEAAGEEEGGHPAAAGVAIERVGGAEPAAAAAVVAAGRRGLGALRRHDDSCLRDYRRRVAAAAAAIEDGSLPAAAAGTAADVWVGATAAGASAAAVVGEEAGAEGEGRGRGEVATAPAGGGERGAPEERSGASAAGVRALLRGGGGEGEEDLRWGGGFDVSGGGDSGSSAAAAAEEQQLLRVPACIWQNLYVYQQEGVRWLWGLHQRSVGGILGDEMGLGKTVQAVAFVAALHHSGILQKRWAFQQLDVQLSSLASSSGGRAAAAGGGPSSNSRRTTDLGGVLIVCPATVVHQWLREFHMWYPPLRVCIFHMKSVDRLEEAARAAERSNGVLLTTYETLRTHLAMLLRHTWKLVILDEGQKIRNPHSAVTLAVKQLQTPHRLLLSATPIQNNLQELWALLDFVAPGCLGTLPVFLEQVAEPITMGGYAGASRERVETAYRCACVLRKVALPLILRRSKAEMQHILRLPKKAEEVLLCHMTSEQYLLYVDFLATHDQLVKKLQQSSGSERRAAADEEKRRWKSLFALSVLRKIANHPDLLLVHNPVLPADYGNPARGGKLLVLREVLRVWKGEGRRVLLFTQTVQMLDIIEAFVRGDFGDVLQAGEPASTGGQCARGDSSSSSRSSSSGGGSSHSSTGSSSRSKHGGSREEEDSSMSRSSSERIDTPPGGHSSSSRCRSGSSRRESSSDMSSTGRDKQRVKEVQEAGSPACGGGEEEKEEAKEEKGQEEGGRRNVGYKYLRLDGRVPVARRLRIIDTFQRDESYFLLLLTTRVGGVGLNITAADRVIIVDPDWNPMTDMQARERSWRIGQQKEVSIYRLVVAGSVEEKIYYRQLFKYFLSQKVLHDPRQRKFFKLNDLQELLEPPPPPPNFDPAQLQQSRMHASRYLEMFAEGVRREERSTLKALHVEAASLQTSSSRRQTSRSHSPAAASAAAAAAVKTEGGGEGHATPLSQEEAAAGAAAESTSGQRGGGGGLQEERNLILQTLLDAGGIQTALSQETWEAPLLDKAIVDRQSKEIAAAAMRALHSSRVERMSYGVEVPTWTGKRGRAGMPSSLQRRLRAGEGAAAPAATAAASAVLRGADRGSSCTAASVLAGLRRLQQSWTSRSSSRDGHGSGYGTASASSSSARESLVTLTFEEKRMAEQLLRFFLDRAHRQFAVTTGELLDTFAPHVPEFRRKLFRAMLKELCLMIKGDERVQQPSYWVLREEFRPTAAAATRRGSAPRAREHDTEGRSGVEEDDMEEKEERDEEEEAEEDEEEDEGEEDAYGSEEEDEEGLIADDV